MEKNDEEYSKNGRYGRGSMGRDNASVLCYHPDHHWILWTAVLLGVGMKLRRITPKGGYVAHLVPDGKWSALCGYGPSSPNAFRMKARSGWRNYCGAEAQQCKKCYEKFNPETMEIQ